MSAEINLLKELMYGHSDVLTELQGEVGGSSNLEKSHPVAELVKVYSDGPGYVDSTWSKPIGTVTLSAEFLEHSNQRFEKARGAIRKIFANNPEAAEEAIELAKQMLAEARAEALALIAA